jgi:hypothetical protein
MTRLWLKMRSRNSAFITAFYLNKLVLCFGSEDGAADYRGSPLKSKNRTLRSQSEDAEAAEKNKVLFVFPCVPLLTLSSFSAFRFSVYGIFK